MEDEKELTLNSEMPEFRNPKYNTSGTIDCEIKHAEFGWIPFTADPNDEVGAAIHAALLAGEAGDVLPCGLNLVAEARKTAILNNNTAYNAATRMITADYPQSEKDTWPTQDKEIKAYQADPEGAETPWIDTAAAVRGVHRIDYISRTIAKVALFEQASAYLTGLRQKYEDQIKAATTVAAIEALTFTYSLPGG